MVGAAVDAPEASSSDICETGAEAVPTVAVMLGHASLNTTAIGAEGGRAPVRKGPR